MSLSIIDFLPVIMAVTLSAVGLAFVKLLVYLHRRQVSHPDVRRINKKQAHVKRAGLGPHGVRGAR